MRLIIVATGPAAGSGHHGPPPVNPGTARDNLGTMSFHPPLSDSNRRPKVLVIYYLELVKDFFIGIFTIPFAIKRRYIWSLQIYLYLSY